MSAFPLLDRVLLNNATKQPFPCTYPIFFPCTYPISFPCTYPIPLSCTYPIPFPRTYPIPFPRTYPIHLHNAAESVRSKKIPSEMVVAPRFKLITLLTWFRLSILFVRLVAWFHGNLVRLWLVCDSASCFAASDQRLLLLRWTTVAASARVL